MKQIIQLLFVAILGLLATSCQNKIEEDSMFEAAVPELEVSPKFLQFSIGEQTKTIQIKSSAYWKVKMPSGADDFIRLSANHGNGTESVNVQVINDNKTGQLRSSTFTITDGVNEIVVEVSQESLTIKDPKVKIDTVYDVTQTTAMCSFSFESPDLLVKKCGLCYSDTNDEPSIENSYSFDVSFKNNINDNSIGITDPILLSGLKPNKKYYVRGYVITEHDSIPKYSNSKDFNTLSERAPGRDDNPIPNY